MPQRVQKLGMAYSDRPFQGAGASLYVATSPGRLYRRLRALPGLSRRRRRRHWVKGSGGAVNIADGVNKTARLASVVHPASSFVEAIPPELYGQTIYAEVRAFKDDVENETTSFRLIARQIDANGDDVTGILGTAVLLSTEVRAGGVVRLRFRYDASRDGLQPLQFRAVATAGPTSPADATVEYAGERIVEIDTPALSDAAPYTYKIVAENGTATLDVLTGIEVQADSSGPPAAATATAVPY